MGKKLGMCRCGPVLPLVLTAAALWLVGCAGGQSRLAVPEQLADQVLVADAEEARGWGDEPVPNMERIASVRREQIKSNRPELLKVQRHTSKLLALSGGGADGAFGAGFLNGWAAAGDRPQFEIVSGVSAGALIAPFAFLGPEYDPQLKEIFTAYSTNDLLKPQLLAGLTGGSAVSDSTPLADLIQRYADREFLTAIALEHKKGRRLLIGTTNLDSQRPVVWDMGEIAARNTESAFALFRRIMLASASIPGIFPPVFIDAHSGGQVYQEMHVDGGTTDNAFLLPSHLDLRELDRRNKVKWSRYLYVIVNSKTKPTNEPVEATTFSIAGRSISTLIKQQTQGDLIKLYLRAKKDGIEFRIASVPGHFNAKSTEPFDKAYMGKLYALGFDLAQNGYKWQRLPRGM